MLPGSITGTYPALPVQTLFLVRSLFLFSVFALALPALHAQELDCNVAVDYSQLKRTDVAFLDDFGVQVSHYFNDQTWTDDRFEPYERISCDMRILFTESTSQTRFRATVTLVARRPIYGTPQTTTLFTLGDETWDFEFVQGTSLLRNLTRFDPLTSFLDFYALLILGYDYDSFAPFGGTRFFDTAREIATRGQSSANSAGWTAFGNERSKGQLIGQLVDPRYRPLRQAFYELHRRGLDLFVTNPEAARANVYGAVENLSQLYNEVSKQYALDAFFQVKADEIIGLLERSDRAAEAYGLLATMDQSQAAKYQRLLN